MRYLACEAARCLVRTTSPTVLLVFQSETSAHLSLRGRARVVEDRTRMQEMWKEPYRVWLPHGPEDSDLALVSVDPIDAEYFDNRGMNKTEYVLNRRKPRSK